MILRTAFLGVLATISVAPIAQARFIASDSTAAEYRAADSPRAGWGMYLGCALGGVEVLNLAAGGRSSRSYIAEGRLERLASQLRAGDLLLIQFGHNDAKRNPEIYTAPGPEFEGCIDQFIRAAQAKGARPILLTPTNKRDFADGVVQPSLSDYVASMRAIAARRRVPIIDVNGDMRSWLTRLGPERAKRFYVGVPAGAFAALPAGQDDATHLTVAGAQAVAAMVARDLVRASFVRRAGAATCGRELATGRLP